MSAEPIYRDNEVFYWLEPLLTDEEFELVEPMKLEAEHFARSIPTADHWV